MADANIYHAGPMTNFNLQCFIDAAEQLLNADETERALQLLDNLPAYYRDNIPAEVLNLRAEVQSRICTSDEYADCQIEINVDPENSYGIEKSLRCQLIVIDVKDLNKKGLIPHIVDYGPGEFWLPTQLKKNGLDFTYDPIYLNQKAFEKYLPYFSAYYAPKKDLKGTPIIFVGCEIIEHLWNEDELKFNMLKRSGGRLADICHVSTPKYTYDHHCLNWRSKDQIGHWRAYTPNEFMLKIQKMFIEYSAFFYDSLILHGRLVSRVTDFKCIADTAGKDLENISK